MSKKRIKNIVPVNNSVVITKGIKNNWKQGWRQIGSVRKYYRSKWEANYARYLEFLKTNKQILDWKHECETFWFDKIKRGTLSYLPDFRILNNDGSVEYVEVKGWMDDRSKTKIKRMKKYYPKVKLTVVGEDWFKNANKIGKIHIKDWE